MGDTERLDVVCETLAARGYTVERGEGSAVATPTEETERVGVPGPLSVVPARTDPATLLRTVGRAAGEGRTALLVAHPVDAPEVRDVLTDPPGLLAASGGERTFYDTHDRVRAGEAGLACCRADDPPVWRERPADGVTGEGTRLVLEADGDPVAAFRSPEDLRRPAPTAFRRAYRRDDDGRFRVRDLETGRTVGRFASVREMRANAYRPVPVPLVPDRVVDGHLPEAWALATVEGGRVTRLEGA